MDYGEQVSVIWDLERGYVRSKTPLLILDPSDIDQAPSIEIVHDRVKHKLSMDIEQAVHLETNPASFKDARESIHTVVENMLAWLQVVKPLNLFEFDSDLLPCLNNIIRSLVKVLHDKVYVTDESSCLIDNEWLLIQNDVALFLEISNIAPTCGAQIGQSFGELYIDKRKGFMAWVQQGKYLDRDYLDANAFIGEIRTRVLACWSCSLHYIRAFGMNRNLHVVSPIDGDQLSIFLKAEGLVAVAQIGDFRVFLTDLLARSADFQASFFNSCTNSKPFAYDFMLIVNAYEINLGDDELFSELRFNEKLMQIIGNYTKTLSDNQMLLCGRSARNLDLFQRKLELAGFQARNLNSECISSYPFEYYYILGSLRQSGMFLICEMLALIKCALMTIKQQDITLEQFNLTNRNYLYAIEFGSVATVASQYLQDDIFQRLLNLFIETIVSWISWLAEIMSSVVPASVIRRWAVSAFDILVPLSLLEAVNLKEKFSKDQVSSLSSAFDILSMHKKHIATEVTKELACNIEYVSMFKWNRIRDIMGKLLRDVDGDKEKYKCTPLPVQFLSPFEKFVSTPLEIALSPLHYQVVRKIYSGPNASLFKCIDLNSGSFVAVKQFYIKKPRARRTAAGVPYSAASSSDESDKGGKVDVELMSKESVPLKEALKEAEVLKVVQQAPYVVKFLNSMYEAPYFFIVTEFYSSGSLESNKILCGRDPEIAESELIWRARFRVLRQVKECLANIHDLGVVHGDIKPANIMFDAFGKVHVGDFGSSEYIPEHPGKSIPLCFGASPRGMHNFTIPYMAPEALKTLLPSRETDIWAYGCLVLELASGAMPWQDLEAIEILVQLHEGRSPLERAHERLNGIPSNFLRLIELCLQADPALRPTARELLELHYSL